MKKKSLGLDFIWKTRLKLQAEADELRAKADKLWAKNNELQAEADELWAKAENLWAKAVLEVYGDIKLEWLWSKEKQAYRCRLATGEIFEP